ncbi:MAG TPA: helix-turn-helix transcriptional regulator [Lacunisphaera sp.]|jgi:transcriptional regulator with XRE-family HTH domain
MASSFSVRLKDLREGAGLSLNTLARVLSVAVSTLSRLESAEMTNPSMSITERLCAFYGVNRDWLIEGSGEKFSALDPRKTRERFFALMAELSPPGGEADLREQKLMAEISTLLAQAPYADVEQWASYEKTLCDAIADYRVFCLEHFAAQRMEQRKIARAGASTTAKK